jgi:chlorobactene glucosyltransferase
MFHATLAAAAGIEAVFLALVLANLALLPRLPRRGPSRGPSASIVVPARASVVVPARNEERDVEASVRSYLAQDYPDLEVVVVDDRSTDATPAILERLAGEDPRLRVVSGVDPPAGWLGKPHALAEGSAASRGELLLFADADVRYAPETLSRAAAHLEGRGLDFLCLLPRIEMRGFWENVLLPYLYVALFQSPAFAANWRRPRWVAVGGGAGNLVRRAAYEKVGGHAALRDSVIDDVRLGFTVKAAGFRFGLVRAEDGVAVRMYRGFREVFDGFTKNAAYVYQGAAGIVFFVLTGATLGAALLPPAVLAAKAAGASIAAGDVRLAIAGFVLALLARVVLARALRDPLWAAFTHPIMAAVWTGILSRSLFHRFVKRRLTWRGREFEARAARF